ncbi:MAG: glycosyltransferase family 2 protein [Candidatus Portnoybacteria bacterium]|nr:glycosyltransferase family 2 protein [Candidatus Portnoybacteria bacterium]
MKHLTLSIIVPAYNEERTIEDTLINVLRVKIPSIQKELIVIDDGSCDHTPLILKRLQKFLPFTLITHEQNKGKGRAIRSGISHARGDFVIIQDADFEYNPEEYPYTLAGAIKRRAKVIYGSRILNPKNNRVSFSYYWGGRLITWFTNILYGTTLTDVTTGYKLFETKLLKTIPLKCNRFGFCVEVSAKIARRGIAIEEIPITYSPRLPKEGKKLKRRDGLFFLWILIKYKFVD